MKFKSIAAIAIASALLFVSTSGSAWARGPGGMGKHQGPMFEEAAAELGLDDNTVAALKEIRREARDAIMEIKFEIKKLKVTMHDLLDEETPNESQIMRLIEEMGKLEIEVRKTRTRALIKARSYLTVEQRATFKKLKKEARRKGPKNQRRRANF